MFKVQRAFAVAVILLAGVLSAGCAPSQPNPRDFVGKTLDAAQGGLSGSLTIIDISQDVVHLPPTYNSGLDSQGWTVLVACIPPGAPSTRQLGIIPQAAVTKDIIAKAKNGAYEQYLPDCVKK